MPQLKMTSQAEFVNAVCPSHGSLWDAWHARAESRKEHRARVAVAEP